MTPPEDETVEPGMVSLELELPHSPQKVWRALTDPKLLTEWLLPVAELELAPGAEFVFRADPQPGWDGVVNCRYLEIVEHRKLSWAWVVGEIDTVVTITLQPTDTGTTLSIEQTGFKPNQKKNLAGARYGWKMMSSRLVDMLGRAA